MNSRSFTAIAMVAVANGVNISDVLARDWKMTERHWHADGAFVDGVIAAGTPFRDPDFPPTRDSMGTVEGDTANS
jgi:hypothetical protein